MKQIAALLLATVALLTFGDASASDRWGWSKLEAPQLLPAAHDDPWVPVDALGTYVTQGAARVKVVSVSVAPAAAKVPGALASALPEIEEALAAIRAVVAHNAALSTNLRARGFKPDDVVGLTHGPAGEVTLFVSNQV